MALTFKILGITLITAGALLLLAIQGAVIIGASAGLGFLSTYL